MAATGTMFIMGRSGDTRVSWDRDNPAEVEQAERTFKDYLGKGYKAFAVNRHGKKEGEPLKAFDKDAAEVIFVAPVAGG